MVDVDPDTLLEWLSMGQGDERDMQLIALEQLCMLLLMSDNIDRCFERWGLAWSVESDFISCIFVVHSYGSTARTPAEKELLSAQ